MFRDFNGFSYAYVSKQVISIQMPCRQVTMAYGEVRRLLLWNLFSALLMSSAFLVAFYSNGTLLQIVYAGVSARLLLYILSYPMFVVGYVPRPWSTLFDTMLRTALPIVVCSLIIHLLAIDVLAYRLAAFAVCLLVTVNLNKNLLLNLSPKNTAVSTSSKMR